MTDAENVENPSESLITKTNSESSLPMEPAQSAVTSTLTQSLDEAMYRIQRGIEWLSDTYGEDWADNLDVDQVNVNSSNLHVLTLVSGKDINLWLLDGGEPIQKFLCDNGFIDGEEHKQYETTELQQYHQDCWVGLIYALQLQRRNRTGEPASAQTQESEQETGRTVPSTEHVVLEDERRRAEGDSTVQYGDSSPSELRQDDVQRSGSEARSSDSETGECQSQFELFN